MDEQKTPDGERDHREYAKEQSERYGDFGAPEPDDDDAYDCFSDPWNPLELTEAERRPGRAL